MLIWSQKSLNFWSLLPCSPAYFGAFSISQSWQMTCVLLKLKKLAAGTYVLGHGPTMHGHPLLQRLKVYGNLCPFAYKNMGIRHKILLMMTLPITSMSQKFRWQNSRLSINFSKQTTSNHPSFGVVITPNLNSEPRLGVWSTWPKWCIAHGTEVSKPPRCWAPFWGPRHNARRPPRHPWSPQSQRGG